MRNTNIIALFYLLIMSACKKEVFVFKIDRTSLILQGSAGSRDSFSIQSNIDWKISISPSTATWLKADLISGSNGKQVFIETTEENPGLSDREATIIVTPINNSQLSEISIPVKNRFYHWSKVFGGTGGGWSYALTPSPDGGFVVAGYTYSNDGDFNNNHGDMDLAVVKTDSDGNKVWTKAIGGTNAELANAIITTQDAGYLVVGQTNSPDGDVIGNTGTFNTWVIKLDANGNILWNRTYGGTGIDWGHSVTSTIDGGYVIVSWSRSNDGDVSGNHEVLFGDFWILKIGTGGNIIWQKCFGGTYYDIPTSIVSTSDGGVVVAGNTESTDGDVIGYHGNRDAWVVKLTADGNIVWRKVFGGMDYDDVRCIVTSPDGGFVIGGSTLSNDGDLAGVQGNGSNSTFPCGWIFKMDGAGNKLWSKKMGSNTGQTFFTSIVRSPDDGYVLTANVTGNDGDVIDNHGSNDAWIVKINSDGNIVNKNIYGSPNSDDPSGLVRSTQGYYAATGTSAGGGGDIIQGAGNYEIWLFKFKVD